MFWFSCWFVGIGLVVPVLFLVLADHDSDGLRGVDILLVEVEYNQLVDVCVVDDLQVVKIIFLPSRSFDVYLNWDDFLDWLKWLFQICLDPSDFLYLLRLLCFNCRLC